MRGFPQEMTLALLSKALQTHNVFSNREGRPMDLDPVVQKRAEEVRLLSSHLLSFFLLVQVSFKFCCSDLECVVIQRTFPTYKAFVENKSSDAVHTLQWQHHSKSKVKNQVPKGIHWRLFRFYHDYIKVLNFSYSYTFFVMLPPVPASCCGCNIIFDCVGEKKNLLCKSTLGVLLLPTSTCNK